MAAQRQGSAPAKHGSDSVAPSFASFQAHSSGPPRRGWNGKAIRIPSSSEPQAPASVDLSRRRELMQLNARRSVASHRRPATPAALLRDRSVCRCDALTGMLDCRCAFRRRILSLLVRVIAITSIVSGFES